MGNGMNKILPGLYVGNFRDAKDEEQLNENQITHILSIHDNAKPLLSHKEYLCISASDSPAQDIAQYFSQCNDFIHKARISNKNVLIHCLAGVSRSVTVSVAYIMTVTDLGWRDALNAVRGARKCANPNFGFQQQLMTFQTDHLKKEQQRLHDLYPASPFDDENQCRELLKQHRDWVLNGDEPHTADIDSNLVPETAESKADGLPKTSCKRLLNEIEAVTVELRNRRNPDDSGANVDESPVDINANSAAADSASTLEENALQSEKAVPEATDSYCASELAECERV